MEVASGESMRNFEVDDCNFDQLSGVDQGQQIADRRRGQGRTSVGCGDGPGNWLSSKGIPGRSRRSPFPPTASFSPPAVPTARLACGTSPPARNFGFSRNSIDSMDGREWKRIPFFCQLFKQLPETMWELLGETAPRDDALSIRCRGTEEVPAR